jgi:mono/diheme cytochrome c family protein
MAGATSTTTPAAPAASATPKPVSTAPAASAARKPDARAGEALFTDACTECHELPDLTGDDLRSFRENLRSVAAGKKKHKPKLKLTPAETGDVAAWLATLK